MLSRVKTPNPYWKLIENKRELATEYPLKFKCFYDLVLHLAKKGAYIVCDTELMFAEEICFDYIQRHIYIPYLKCDYIKIPQYQHTTAEKVGILDKYGAYCLGYNYTLTQYSLYQENQYVQDTIYIVNAECTAIYTYDISGLPLITLEGLSFEAKDLYTRYLGYCYGYYDEVDVTKFFPFKISQLSHFEQVFYRKNNLNYYGDYTNMNYNQVRMYPIQQILLEYTTEELQLGVNYNIRRINFEGQLFCRCAMGKEYLWTNWSKGDMTKLLNKEQYFCKYKEGKVALIFKSAWVNHLINA